MAGMRTVEEHIGSMSIAECLGVKDLSGQRHHRRMGQHPLRVPNVADRVVTEEGHYPVLEVPLDLVVITGR
eukprot:10822937-Prorocentrum_lima.AAC.1